MIHSENPFADDPGARDPVRRFRGRLSAPVTVVTSGEEEWAGLTVASLMIIEGEPGHVEMVVGPTSDLWDVIAETSRFVIHVCDASRRSLSEVFAGLRPSPGGVFAGLETAVSEWGPVIVDLPDRAYCTFLEKREVGHSGLISGQVDRVELSGLSDPLVYFRGSYHTLQR